MACLCFRLLGPVEVLADGEAVRLSSGRQEKVLAALLFEAGRAVPVGALVDAVWDEDPPRTAHRQVRNLATGLRRLLVAAGAPETILVASGPGFRLDLTGCRYDVREFEELAAAGDHRAALQLWRGPAAAGLDGGALSPAVAGLEERRLSVLEQWLAAELERGAPGLADELAVVVAKHPLREGFVSQLMTALYRDGRQVDALAAYATLRAALVEQLGVEPGGTVRSLHEQILQHDDALEPAPATLARPLPRQLPGTVDPFTGRAALLEDVCSTLRDSGGVVLLVGPAGVGKTALAVAAATATADEFPDGQLFADLHGLRDDAADAHVVLGRFLGALGVRRAALPDDPDERVSLYRSTVAGRRLLVVLDDATSERQVRPLLPGGSSGTTVITSRRRLGGLVGARRWTVPVLDHAAGLDLLSRGSGRRRPAIDGAAAEIVELCGGLPLAVCIAAGRLAVRPDLTTEQFRDRLRAERQRLDVLTVGDLDVRAAIGMSYAALGPPLRLLFRRLGTVTAPDWPLWVAGRLASCDRDVRDLVDRLVDLHLVEPARGDPAGEPRYRMHDLVAEFARERTLAEDSGPERMAAARRVLSGWSARASDPGTPDHWFDTETASLRWSIEYACSLGLGELAGRTALPFSRYLALRGCCREYGGVIRAAAQALREEGHDELLVLLLSPLFVAASGSGTSGEMVALAAEQLQLARRLRDRPQELRATINAAWAQLRSGRLAATAALLDTATAMVDAGSPPATVAALHVAASTLHMERGDAERALPHARQALAAARSAGSTALATRAHLETAIALTGIGRLTEAEQAVEHGLELAAANRDELHTAYLDHVQAEIDTARGDQQAAADRMKQVIFRYEAEGDRVGVALALDLVGDVLRVQGRPREAVERLAHADRIWRSFDFPLQRARTLSRAEQALLALGDQGSAAEHRAEYRSILAALGLDDTCLRPPVHG